MNSKLAEQVGQVLPKVIELRRDFHRWPELGYQERKTADKVASYLQSMGITPEKGIAETGVTGLIDVNSSSNTVAFRADMDALPLTETTDVPYKSENKGVAHSCGHDGHTAALLGAAGVLSSLRDMLQVNVRLVFQPAEEGGGGGEKMVQSGVLKDPPVDAIFALHSWPDLSTGQIGYKYGVMFAGTDSFNVVIRGKGGHAAHPHKAIDPIVMAARAIDGFQTIVSRTVNPLSPTVLTVARIEGGTTHNVIPEYVNMQGTIRTLDRGVRESVIASMRRVLDSVAEMYGAPTPDLQITRGTPSLNNDKDAVDYVVTRARSLLSPDDVVELNDPSMGGEDFVSYLDEVPGAMYRLGVGSKSKSFLHTPTFDFDDGALRNGIMMIATLALDFRNNWVKETQRR